MYGQNMYYPSYYSYGYRSFGQNPYNIPFYQNNYENVETDGKTSPHNGTIENFKNDENLNENDCTSENNSRKKEKSKIFDFSNNRLSIFGFSLAIDDLIIIALIFLLLLDSEIDYALLIILGLMLFNISISSIGLFS